MKRNNTKRSLEKFSKRNVHKRRGKEKAKNELMRALNEVGVSYDSVKLSSAVDGGRRARRSAVKGKDETVCRGVYSSSKSGFGFVAVEGVERDIFIPEGKSGGAIDGDLVEIVYHEYESRFGETKTDGRVRRIVEYGRKTLIGTLEYEMFLYSKKRRAQRLVLIPDDPRIFMRPVVNDAGGASEGDKVEVKILRTGAPELECEVIRSFGRTESREANYEAILAECEIEADFSKEELAEAEFFAAAPISDEGRVRRTRDIIFTIDGEGAKDLDDAVSVKRLNNGGWQLGVHIADVSHYVRERTHLDRAVMRRGTSVYFTDKVVPMLPKSLSNGACSLNPNEEKYALSAIITISEAGDIISAKIEPSVIKSRVRGVYSEVNRILSGDADAELISKYKEVIPSLRKMHELYFILKAKSERRGAIELDSPEAEIILSELGEPVDIVKRERGDAERLIEQFMLAANEAVATLLTEKGIPCVYRVHDAPSPEKLSDFLEFLQNLKFDTRMISREKPKPSELASVIEEAEKRGISEPVSYLMLRSMAKAKYSENQSLHFGLGIELYCHFTSPIRRLSDLATHRIIHKVLIEGKRAEMYASYARRAAAAATDAELRAVSAERRIENLYKVIYMEKFVGEEFYAMINSVTSFGFFAELPNTCEGLVPISSLSGVFTFDEKNIMLRSRYKEYRLGDTVKIKIEEADRIRGKLRFSVVDGE